LGVAANEDWGLCAEEEITEQEVRPKAA